MPVTFVALLVSGSWTERGTDGSAAWWSTTSQPRTRRCGRARSSGCRPRRARCRRARRAGSRGARWRSCRARARRARPPAARSTMCEPMKPPPPVTKTFTVSNVPAPDPSSDVCPSQKCVRLDDRLRALDIRSKLCLARFWTLLPPPMQLRDASTAATLLAASDLCCRARGDPFLDSARGAHGCPCGERSQWRQGGPAEGQEGRDAQGQEGPCPQAREASADAPGHRRRRHPQRPRPGRRRRPASATSWTRTWTATGAVTTSTTTSTRTESTTPSMPTATPPATGSRRLPRRPRCRPASSA